MSEELNQNRKKLKGTLTTPDDYFQKLELEILQKTIQSTEIIKHPGIFGRRLWMAVSIAASLLLMVWFFVDRYEYEDMTTEYDASLTYLLEYIDEFELSSLEPFIDGAHDRSFWTEDFLQELEGLEDSEINTLLIEI